jgi:Tol biopolymer transport system component
MSPGLSIAHYCITSKLGEGGMGEVWRARDTKLNRDVAIKILPDAFANDPDRLARFTREAQVLASLNHPNIAAIYGVEERALVMELVEGETLPRALSPETALNYARQIAEALEYAHERGVVHRDLKPANIKVTPEGKVKVLDFGLAVVAQTSAGAPMDPMSTKSMDATLAGTVLGTPAYMSPEQARGQEVDRRTDIWAFGVVLYEILAGRPLFAASTTSDTLAAVLKTEPDLSAVPTATRSIIERCLRKDPRRRWRDIGDVRLTLEEGAPAAVLSSPVRSSSLPWTIAICVALAAAVACWLLWRRAISEERVITFQIAPPPGARFVLGSGGGSAISPDARTIAFSATAQGVPKLWIRPLNSLKAREVPGTEGAVFPFWSPDSRSLGFFAGGKMKRVDLSGGSPFVLANAPTPRGGTWGGTGMIVFAPASFGSLEIVPADGGKVTSLTTLDSAGLETSHRWPQFLPGGRRLLYYSMYSQPRLNAICLVNVDRPSVKNRLLESPTPAQYIPAHGRHPGVLVWLRGRALMARALDPDSGRFSGDILPVPGAEEVSLSNFYAGFSTANDGTILFSTGSELYRLTWFSRDGKPLAAVGPPDRFFDLRIAPDATRVAALVNNDSGGRDISIIDFARGIPTRLTSGDVALVPVWSPDSRRISYSVANGTVVYERNANGAGPRETLVESHYVIVVDDYSPDGRLLYEDLTGGYGNLWLIPRNRATGERKVVPYLRATANLSNAQFSPDGKWIAYTSDESGQPQIYVESYPANDEKKRQVSSDGGNFARWRRDGRELFYYAPDGVLMAVSVRAADHGLELGSPAALFRLIEPPGPHAYPYDVALDGKRIMTLAPEYQDNSSILTVLMNWQAALHRSP